MQKEIGLWGKIIAGLLLIFLTAGSGIMIIAYWPDKLPGPKDNIAPLYKNELFHIRLACLPDSPCHTECIYYGECGQDTVGKKTDSLQAAADSTSAPADSIAKDQDVPGAPATVKKAKPARLIHINTLILILVALGGFTGNMIHIATSFTTFVGDKKFERSWVLWYCVKPFTAAALAIGFYFVFRGGFLNMSDDATNINLYGLMTISILTGLFTDTATLKLKEVFEILFKPKDSRTGKREDDISITGVSPLTIEKNKENKLEITGTNMTNTKLLLFINDEPVANPVISATAISFSYTIPETQKDKTVFKLAVKDEKGKEYKTFDLALKQTGAGGDTEQEGN